MDALCKVRDIYRAVNDFEVNFQRENGIGLNEGMLLCSISKLGRCSSGQIAELLGLTLSNSSKVILSAEKKGLIERSMGTEDKRRMFFTLTAAGKERIDGIHCESGGILEFLKMIKEI